MNKEYKEIECLPGCTIEDAVNELIAHKEKGILAYTIFNDVPLYSDKVTLDNAYKQITGRTKAEFENECQKQKSAYEMEENKHKENIQELTNMWMQKGREILTEDKWEFWDKIVPIRLNDLYRGMELGACLEIVEILNSNGTLDEAKAKIESQGHSGMSFGLICSMIIAFSSRGEEFINYIKL